MQVTRRQLRQLIKDSLLTEDFTDRSSRRAMRSYDRDFPSLADRLRSQELEITQWRELIDEFHDLVGETDSELTVGDFFGSRGEGGRWWRKVDTLKKTYGK